MYARTRLAAGLLCLLAGCVSTDVRKDIDRHLDDASLAIATPTTTPATPRVTHGSDLFIPVRKAADEQDAWLRAIAVDLTVDRPIAMSEIVRKLAAQGLNITTSLPLDQYTYAGRINRTDAQTALRAILGAVGLDYDSDNATHLISLRPQTTRTWILNVGNRSTSFSAGSGNSESSGSNGGSSNGLGGQSGSGGSGDLFGGGSGGDSTASLGGNSSSNGGSSSGNNNGGGDGNSDNSSQINTYDDFWRSLDRELQARLRVLPPPSASIDAPPMLPPGSLPPPIAFASPASTDRQPQKIGTYALNPETGAVTVQAPHWIINDLDTYLRGVQRMYNADITFSGQLLLVNRSRTDSEGIDLSTFRSFASGRYGAVVANNALGGVTVSFPDAASEIPNAVAGAQSVGGALLGVVSPADGVSIFNAFLAEHGRVTVVQRPVLTTTSGVPAQFSKFKPRFFNLVSQQATGGGVSGSVQATQNTLRSKQFGMLLTINPRYDITTGLIRAQISLEHVIDGGDQVLTQTISSGDSFQNIPTRIPLDTRITYSGEALLRDGDVIIVGGQTEENLSLDENGLPIGQAPLSGLFGTKRATRTEGTYYFALRVALRARS